MSNNHIECPKCKHQIPIDDILKHRLNEQVKGEVDRRLILEKEKLAGELKAQISADATVELKIAQEKLKIETQKRDEAQKRELAFIKKQSELEDKLKSQDLEIARKIAEEKKLLEEKLNKDFEEKKNFAEMELRKQLDDTKKALSEAQRKAAQGSTQTQGEVLELTLEENLRKKFPHDEIEPVGKGITGADITQKVFAPNGEMAGVIAWESKQTKAWTEEWINKLKDDGHRVKANLLILISNILPKEVERFGQYKGIWVTDYASSLGLAAALRNNLLSIYSVALANENSQDKAQLLYKHLTSQTFANRVRTIAETFIKMRSDIDREKRAFDNIWANREKEIERLSVNTSQMFGEIHGIAGGQFSGIDVLENLNKPALEKPAKKSEKNNQVNLF